MKLFAAENYEELQPLLEKLESLPVSRREMLVSIPAWHVVLAIARDDYDSARHHWDELNTFHDLPWFLKMYSCFASFSLEKAGRYKEAVMLCARGFRAQNGWRLFTLLNHMLDRIKARLGPDDYEAAFEQGKTLTNDDILAILEAAGLT